MFCSVYDIANFSLSSVGLRHLQKFPRDNKGESSAGKEEQSVLLHPSEGRSGGGIKKRDDNTLLTLFRRINNGKKGGKDKSSIFAKKIMGDTSAHLGKPKADATSCICCR